MSAALPFAFAGRGLAVGAYALMQIGRSGFDVAGGLVGFYTLGD